MQPWNQVKVIAGDYEGEAGVVQHVEDIAVTVQLDGHDAPCVIDISELQVLG